MGPNGFKKFFLSPTIPFFLSGSLVIIISFWTRSRAEPPLVTVSPVTVQKTVKSERDDWPGLARKMALDSLPLQLKRCQGRAGQGLAVFQNVPVQRDGPLPDRMGRRHVSGGKRCRILQTFVYTLRRCS